MGLAGGLKTFRARHVLSSLYLAATRALEAVRTGERSGLLVAWTNACGIAYVYACIQMPYEYTCRNWRSESLQAWSAMNCGVHAVHARGMTAEQNVYHAEQ